MGNLILSTRAKIGYYFENKNRDELNILLANNNNSVEKSATQEGAVIQIVIDFVTVANISGVPNVSFDYATGKVTLVYIYAGYCAAKTEKHCAPIDIYQIASPFFTANVIVIDQPPGGALPISDSAAYTTDAPPSEHDAISIAKDD